MQNEAFEIFFEKVDSTIGERDIAVFNSPTKLGITNSVNTIEIGFDIIKSYTKKKSKAEQFATIKGVNYHELGHILFGIPISEEKVINSTGDRVLAKLINILEDQRCENLFTIMFRKTKDYFRLSCLNLYSLNEKDLFIKLYGRKRFIDLNLIKVSEQIFQQSYHIIDSDMELIKKYINEYITGNEEARMVNAFLLFELLKKYGNKPKSDMDDIKKEMKGKLGKKEIDKLNNKLKKEITEMTEKENNDKCNEGKDNNNKENDKSDDSKENNNDDTEKDSNNIDDMIKQEVERTMEKINDEMIDDIKSIREIEKSGGLSRETEFDKEGEVYGKKMKTNYSINKFRRIFERIKDNSQYEWVKNKRSGRLNLRKAMNKDNKNIFKKWNIGKDDKFLAGIVLDVSSSTAKYHDDFINGSFAFCKAIEGVGESFIIAFATETKVIKEISSRKVNDIPNLGGSTRQENTLYEAVNRFRSRRVDKKILFIFSDLEWFKSDEIEQYFDRMLFSNIKIFIIQQKDDATEPHSRWIKENIKKYNNIKYIEVDNYKEDNIFKTLKEVIEKEVIRKMV